MRCGLFGKLPVKRDFIAEAVPRGFLPVWEPWLQGSISASRLDLGQRWGDLYLRAPLWRFWLGRSHCGATVTGVIMPSVDGVGRSFPLTLMVAADEGETFPAPPADAQDGWYAGAEELLLEALDERLDFEAYKGRIAGLAPPQAEAQKTLPAGTHLLADGLMLSIGSTPVGTALFQPFEAVEAARTDATATYWWTIGGEGFAPLAISGHRLPDPAAFSGFLTGRFMTK